MKRTLLTIMLAAGVMLTACHNDSKPEGLLNQEQMVDFLTEACLIEGYCAIETRYNFDSLTPEMVYAYDEILAEQGITREQVETSLAYYAKHPEEYIAIHENVAAALNDITDTGSVGNDL